MLQMLKNAVQVNVHVKRKWVSFEVLKLRVRLGFASRSGLRLGLQLVNLLVITHSLIPVRRRQLTPPGIQSHSDPFLEPLHRLQNLSSLVLLCGVTMDSIKCADGAVASWEDQ